MKTASFIQILANRRIGIMLPLGFASGLPLALTAGTLQAWLTVVGLDLKTIGIFTLVGLPYTLKFLWAPLMDRLVPPWLGRRRGWMLVMQLSVALGLTAMAVTGPGQRPEVLGVLALVVAFLSASLDIVFDAYRTDLLLRPERGFGAAVWVNGGRGRHDPRESGTVRAECHAGKPGRSGWWTTERILCASLCGWAPRPHC